MSFGTIINTLLLKPLELLFEVIYMMANNIIDNPGLSIIVLSLVINFLVLPLYKRADAMQEEEREMEKRLHKGVTHIKKTFHGEERMMMLQTYYRQNGYKPTYVLRGAISLILEIPFFIAAYQFLSHLQLLSGVAFGPIVNLGKPDAILSFAGVSINVLPIIMTAINLISCVIFTKGSLLKSKIQLYAMALFFFVFLYSSPAGLVFYWTLNNAFSLVKTIFYKLKNPMKVLSVIFSLTGACLLIYGLFFYNELTVKRTVFFWCCGIFLQMPLIYDILRNKVHVGSRIARGVANRKIFLAGGVFLSVLIGILIPSAVIKASPQEFIDINYFHNPIWYIVSSFCFALGTFLIWAGVFYWLAKPTVKVIMDKVIWIFSAIAVVGYMFFGKNLGILTSDLKFENGLNFTWKEQTLNAIIIFLVIIVFYYIATHWKKEVFKALVIATIAMGSMAIINVVDIGSSVNSIRKQVENSQSEMPEITLSKSGKNVIVLMLDRAMAQYVPYLFNEKPELKERFSGFTNYTNVVSFGKCTNFGIPPLLGGYEYTPWEMNKRSDESLASKHNEALKVMPVLFEQEGYDVTVCDPVYVNYEWIPNLSIYDAYPGIKSYITKGKFSDSTAKERVIQNNRRNFFCYSVLKTIPLSFQEILYNRGNYYQSDYQSVKEKGYSGQIMNNLNTSSGLNSNFMEPYNVLVNLPKITETSDNDSNTFLLMTNDTTHGPMLLQEPEYIPAQQVDNTEFERENKNRFTLNGNTLKMETEQQITHYQTNMATMLQLGRWFDYMRLNGVYDNTRIILVADHGRELGHVDEFQLPDGVDAASCHPLLMVKDFDGAGFTMSEEFMTNGDVPTLAMRSLIKTPINPFTGKEINSEKKDNQEQYIFGSDHWDVRTNNGNTFLPSKWYSVHDNIWDRDNWKIVAEEAIFPIEE